MSDEQRPEDQLSAEELEATAGAGEEACAAEAGSYGGVETGPGMQGHHHK